MRHEKSDGLSYKRIVAITPSDTVLQENINAVMSTVDSGTAAVTLLSGSKVTMYFIQGVMYPISPKLIDLTALGVTTLIGFE